jgi:hypothetical protein
MVYEGKHAKRGSANGAGSHDGACGPDDDHVTPRQASEAMPLPDVTFDSLEEEESQHGDDSHAQMQRLLGSIHLQGIHPQVVRQADEAEPLPDIAADSLEEEESQDGLGSHLRMQHLLGSIHLQGVRLRSPIYFEGSQRLRTTSVRETPSADRQDAAPRQDNAASQEEEAAPQEDAVQKEDDAAPQEDDMLRDDTVILVAVERPPRDGYPEAGVGEEARPSKLGAGHPGLDSIAQRPYHGGLVFRGHRDCGHVSVGMRKPVSRDRLQSTIILCGCACHAACPLADQAPVPLTVWQQLCTCPGGERYRVWKEDPGEPWPGSKEAREESQRKNRRRAEARRQAFEAARDAAHGKTRDQVRDLYIAGLRARGQEVPPGRLLEAELEFLTGHLLRALWKMKIWKQVWEPLRSMSVPTRTRTSFSFTMDAHPFRLCSVGRRLTAADDAHQRAVKPQFTRHIRRYGNHCRKFELAWADRARGRCRRG